MKLKSLTRQMLAVLALVLAAGGVLAAPPTYQLHVDGLSCPFCSYGIEKKLGALAGVERIETNIRDGTVSVTMQEGLTLDEAVARQAVKAAGFSLRKFEPAQGAAAAPQK
jgi:mercuric ion binding protein